MMALAPGKGNGMARDPTPALVAAASRATCPHCRRHGLKFALRCDLRHGCLSTALCEGCYASFDIVTSETPIDPDDLLKSVGPCPTCGEERRLATLSCSGGTHTCMYRLECLACTRR